MATVPPPPSPAPLRFVVLHHTGLGEPHYDLMLEPEQGANALLSWRIPAWPLQEGAPLTRLPSHRRAYLDYEGPVSGGRGHVQRVAAGSCRTWADGDGGVTVWFEGETIGWTLGRSAERAP